MRIDSRESTYERLGYITESDWEPMRPYITDFAYYDSSKKLCVAIEIDEPYSFETKTPIHINDRSRNRFFLDNNWILLRFAEIQIVKYPDRCCNLIKEVVKVLTEDISNLKSLKSIVPTENKWSYESSLELISINFRNSYLGEIRNFKANDIGTTISLALLKLYGFGQ
ncbi:MAG: hypothetical protein IR153_10150 [Flavobacterium sp.]|nr:hypothetical protein [Flavobacterium sp.]